VSLSPTGVIPEDLMTPGSLLAVMRLLQSMPIPGDDKVDYLIGWCKAVGVTVNAAQRAAVRDSGIDRA
jgi:hypothetical protein